MTFTVRVGDLAFFSSGANRYVLYDGRYGVQISSSAQNSDVELGSWLTLRGKPPTVPSVVSASPVMPGDAGRGIQSRIMFPDGTVVQPQLTVSMNDEALYGHVGARRTRPLPRASTVRYASDHPRVVSVDRGGTIRTVGDGVATITATVSLNGTSRSTRFVIRVSSKLAQLKVDGTVLPGFSPDTYDYDVIVPRAAKQPKPAKGKGAPKRHRRRSSRRFRGSAPRRPIARPASRSRSRRACPGSRT